MAFPLYQPPPADPPNVFAAFWNNFMEVRNPWATQLFFLRLQQASAGEKNKLLVELEKERGRRLKENEVTRRAFIEADSKTLEALVDLQGFAEQTRRGREQIQGDLSEARIRQETALQELQQPSDQARRSVADALDQLSGTFAIAQGGDLAGALATASRVAENLVGQVGADRSDQGFAAKEIQDAITRSTALNPEERQIFIEAFVGLGAPAEPRAVREFGAGRQELGATGQFAEQQLQRILAGTGAGGRFRVERGTRTQAPAPVLGAAAPAAPITLQSEGAAAIPPRFETVEQATEAFGRGEINDAQFDAAFQQFTGQTPPVQLPPPPVVEEGVSPQSQPTQAAGGLSQIDILQQRIGRQAASPLGAIGSPIVFRPRQASSLEGITPAEMADLLQAAQSGRTTRRGLRREIRAQAAQQGETVARPTRRESVAARIAQGLRAKGRVLTGPAQKKQEPEREAEAAPVLDLDVLGAGDEEAFTIRATTPARRQADELLKQRTIPAGQRPTIQESPELKKLLESLTPEELEIIRSRRQANGG